jgi:hypothetical protein
MWTIGREALNFTALDTVSEDGAKAAGKAGKEIHEGEMPPRDYLLMHPEARLTASERQELARGLDRSFAGLTEGGRGEKGIARKSSRTPKSG